MKPTLNIIGCGTVGRTLGFLWHQGGYFEINDLYSRRRTSAEATRDFIGAGNVCNQLEELTCSSCYLISTSDDQIKLAAEQLACAGLIREGDLVFHCSGALTSDELISLKEQGAHIASAHPVKSFANAIEATRTFNGTFFALEGDHPALEQLQSVIKQIGAQCFPISKEHKTLYHASTSLICNYLSVLMDVGFNWLEKSGLAEDEAKKVVEPLVFETLKNVFTMATPEALTGPIARGDGQTLQKQLDAIEKLSPEHSALFQALSHQALDLAARKLPAPDLDSIREVLVS